MEMRNFFGQEVIESFILVMPAGTQIDHKAKDYTSHIQIEGYDVYIWKKHLKRAENNVVTVMLK